MSHTPKIQQKIDAYLMQLRRSLNELPPEEVSEILKEIRGHILERAETSGELTEEKLVAILKALGSPEQIAPLYQADALVARARSSLSPRVVMRGIHRWSTLSVWGFVLFVLGLVGYATGASLIMSGLLKIFLPGKIGAWVGPHALFDIGANNDPAARDVLGWWLVPLGLLGGPAVIMATTRILRWTLRFARIRRPTTA
jgi:uncharacterized membrane protein